MSKVELLKIVIKLKDSEINLTPEEAKELKQILEDIFKNTDEEKEYVPYPTYPTYPTYPICPNPHCPAWPQYYYTTGGSSTITISGNANKQTNTAT